MNNKFTYTIKRTRFDENYNPAENTRITTNFANLARGVGNDSNLLIVFYVQIVPDDFVMQLHR
ncbi:putative oxygenase MesX, partial [Klebsiella pneumoniae]|uniref:putative oxygenase MesX n=1 Tax=Klebsiella pneumoniae TaxID=573 RepID=UPI000E3ED446